MTLADRANELGRVLGDELDDKTPGLLKDSPVDLYLRKIDAVAGDRGYSFVATAMRKPARSIRETYSESSLWRYHRLVLMTLIERSEDRLRMARVPSSVTELYGREFDRIVSDTSTNPLSFYDFDNDLFLKDLCICANKLHPCGAELAEVQFRVPRSIVLAGGLMQFFLATTFFLWRVGGFSPFYSLHMDRRFLKDFTPDGWDRTYHRLAELLELHPEIRGVLGTAWFYDPALENISPHLSYLRKKREDNGAKGFYFTTGDEVTRAALKRSQTRRRLYEQGRYTPRPYYLVWPRKDLIAWARRNPPTHSTD